MSIDFVHNFKAGKKLWNRNICFVKCVRFLCMLFLETSYLFHITRYYVSLPCSHIWIIDKLETQPNCFSLNMFLIITEL